MEQMKNDKIVLSEIFHAIKTCQAGKGDVEAFGIANAFIRAIKADKNCLVLFQDKEQDGKTEKVFVMIKDKAGRTVFPMFTDISKVLPFKQKMEQRGKVEIGVMSLRMLFAMLATKQMCEGVIVNPMMQNFTAPLSFFISLLQRDLTSHVTLIEAELSELHTEATVCPTDEKISGRSVVDSKILNAGGDVFKDAIQKEMQDTKLEAGDVVAVQSKGDLRSKYVLFANTPSYSANMKMEEVFAYYINCMNVAKELQCTSIAFPCTSIAMKGLPMEAVIGASTKAVTTWLSSHRTYAIDVYFCCNTKEEKDLYHKFFARAKK